MASTGRAESAAKALRRRQIEPGRVERRFPRRQQPVGRCAGQIVERAAQRRLGRPQIERAVAIAAVDQIGAQRIEREIERDREIAGQIRPRDLQPVGLEIVDMPLAEAALLADLLLRAHRTAALAGHERGQRAGTVRRAIGIVAVRFAVAVTSTGGVSGRGAFDQALMDQELALVADRDDNAGALAVGFAVDRFGLGRLDDLVAALFETRGFHHQIVAELLVRQFAQFLEPRLDPVEFGGDLGRIFGRLRLDAAVCERKP